MIGYKVCRISDGRFFSCFAFKASEYKKGKWTKRVEGCGPLAIFDCYFNARSFRLEHIRHFEHLKIFECEYEPSEDNKLWLGLIDIMEDGFPIGTIFADKVKIL